MISNINMPSAPEDNIDLKAGIQKFGTVATFEKPGALKPEQVAHIITQKKTAEESCSEHSESDASESDDSASSSVSFDQEDFLFDDDCDEPVLCQYETNVRQLRMKVNMESKTKALPKVAVP